MNHNHITPSSPWYNTSRISAWQSCNEGHAVATLLVKNRPLLTHQLLEVDTTVLIKLLETDVIDAFLKCENLRIVVDEEEVQDNLTLEVELEDIDDLVTEELAEIYATQGLLSEAKAIYIRLSLLNSEKSVYFAKLIANITAAIEESKR